MVWTLVKMKNKKAIADWVLKVLVWAAVAVICFLGLMYVLKNLLS